METVAPESSHAEDGSIDRTHGPYDPVGNPNVEHAFHAVRAGHTDYLSAITDNDVLRSVMRRANDGFTLSHMAAEHGKIDVLLLLRERGWNVAGLLRRPQALLGVNAIGS